MQTLDLSLPEPAHNLACDEILLDEVNEKRREPVLRFWESRTHLVVLGYGNSIKRECDTVSCQRLDIPILCRISGGGAVLLGPGCLNYSIVMRIAPGRADQSVNATNCRIMAMHREAIGRALAQAIEVQGYTDLTWGGFKFSGNAQRRRRNTMLFHGLFCWVLTWHCSNKP